MFNKLKRYLGAGILITAPIGITLYLAWLVIDGVDNTVAELIPESYMPKYSVPGLGFLLVIALLIVIGATTAGYVGKFFTKTSEAIMEKTPVLNSIYNTLKQIFDTVFSKKGNSFKEVVLVEYPIKGMWAMAFVTSDSTGEIKDKLPEDEFVNLFLPTTPNPTSGFLLFVPRKSTKRMDMTVEEAMKLLISAGIMTPMSNKEKLEAKLLAEKKKLAKKSKKPKLKKPIIKKKTPKKK
ncbi:MAG: DUF502 domain-containing protein [Alphaproteobacteria bacterium]|nr:DUF502 domain-containing protein [Alphaproteobacteria bacterium]